MFIKIDFESETPIYTQIRNQIVEGIAKSYLSEGDELPSVRQLAVDIGINMHTVNKAYSVLKQEGFIRLDRRKGAVISFNFQSKDHILSEVQEELQVILYDAACKKITKEEIRNIVDRIYSEIKNEELGGEDK